MYLYVYVNMYLYLYMYLYVPFEICYIFDPHSEATEVE